MAQLTNRADFSGLYDTMQVTDFTLAVVELEAVELIKSANKYIWLDDGTNLQYTITARNLDLAETGLPLTGVTLTDTINTEIVTLLQDSITLTIGQEPVEDVDFTFQNGVLTVQVGAIPPGQTATLTFLVERAE